MFRSRRAHCNQGSGEHPLYVNVDMMSGAIHTSWIDSLQAAFAGIQASNQYVRIIRSLKIKQSYLAS